MHHDCAVEYIFTAHDAQLTSTQVIIKVCSAVGSGYMYLFHDQFYFSLCVYGGRLEFCEATPQEREKASK